LAAPAGALRARHCCAFDAVVLNGLCFTPETREAVLDALLCAGGGDGDDSGGGGGGCRWHVAVGGVLLTTLPDLCCCAARGRDCGAPAPPPLPPPPLPPPCACRCCDGGSTGAAPRRYALRHCSSRAVRTSWGRPVTLRSYIRLA